MKKIIAFILLFLVFLIPSSKLFASDAPLSNMMVVVGSNESFEKEGYTIVSNYVNINKEGTYLITYQNKYTSALSSVKVFVVSDNTLEKSIGLYQSKLDRFNSKDIAKGYKETDNGYIYVGYNIAYTINYVTNTKNYRFYFQEMTELIDFTFDDNYIYVIGHQDTVSKRYNLILYVFDYTLQEVNRKTYSGSLDDYVSGIMVDDYYIYLAGETNSIDGVFNFNHQGMVPYFLKLDKQTLSIVSSSKLSDDEETIESCFIDKNIVYLALKGYNNKKSYLKFLKINGSQSTSLIINLDDEFSGIDMIAKDNELYFMMNIFCPNFNHVQTKVLKIIDFYQSSVYSIVDQKTDIGKMMLLGDVLNYVAYSASSEKARSVTLVTTLNNREKQIKLDTLKGVSMASIGKSNKSPKVIIGYDSSVIDYLEYHYLYTEDLKTHESFKVFDEFNKLDGNVINNDYVDNTYGVYYNTKEFLANGFDFYYTSIKKVPLLTNLSDGNSYIVGTALSSNSNVVISFNDSIIKDATDGYVFMQPGIYDIEYVGHNLKYNISICVYEKKLLECSESKDYGVSSYALENNKDDLINSTYINTNINKLTSDYHIKETKNVLWYILIPLSSMMVSSLMIFMVRR